ncbi:Adenylate cyclase type 9 [Habropoda laboriosa]|uniref:Adenylate cyclase type 9 n=1 Tax=Habropoda laboriosa TaxID=597456 RepID=A0A0L7R2U1_9HYME|nr:Adenylate cyclase type 9 [Habropoda laboriosa]
MTPPLNRKRSSSVSFTRAKDDSEDAADEIHISLAPYIQTYLAHSGQGLGCCGISLPVPFERAAPRSWWNPRFDSEILEDQFKRSAFPQIRLRFRYALTYILLVSLSWLVYFVIIGTEYSTTTWPAIAAVFTIVGAMVSAVLYLTHTDYYKSYVLPISLGVASMLCILSLLFLTIVPPYIDGLTLVGHFALCSEILLLIYTVLPMPLYACVGISTIYSFLFEFLTAYLYGSKKNILTHNNGEISNYLLSSNISNRSFSDDNYFSTNLGIRILMQVCIHLIGIHILIMTFVRMRGTFMKVGQSLLVRRQLEMEKQLKEKMIHSVMPPKVADWLMEESERGREREDSLKKGSIPSNNTDIRSLFRPFNMHSMENVSILFADIVGFTRMSSNKTAEELVGILNDLFERFDDLCEHHGCEKISTLGDCYYCVSGCPEPRPDHAKCCIEMGLAMIEAIKQFDIERREGVNMRVGVHTGTVLCGIVGTKRFKFDVWSNDVTLANKLESTGKPGRVHLSEKTLSFLNDRYLTEEGDLINGIKTYFIKGRKSDFTSQFIMNITSPKSISPLMQSRHRLASCNSQSKSKCHYLHMVTNTSNYRMKANSLPSILDSENGDTDTADEKEDASKSPISVASYGKKKMRNKPWKYLQRQRTTEEMTPLEMEEAKAIIAERSKTESQSYEDRNGFRQNTSQNDIEMDPNPIPSSPLLSGQEPLSRASSMCSRKDSGIRSNSRRSSIQQQLFLMNGMAQGDLLTHRVSGYYTSSSTLNSVHEPSSSVPPYPFPPAVTDTFGACFHKLRKQSDLQLIRCVQDNVSSQRSYFVKPPLSSLTLFFKNKEMEKEYRENAHKSSMNQQVSYRLSFHGNAVAARDKSCVQSMKNQADWLLHNIIPKYVADQLKTTAKYSQNHKAVGIIFASIVNFNELYDESYLGGKEYLRVLNELIGDFDELLEKSEFSNVEKIKTIGSTFMAASGLNPQVRQQSEHEYAHLFQLLDFAVAMHKVINDFNRDLLGFKLILRIGFNYGDVTAGVIGATKLYYDIWGDAVNIASRMDSTGVAGRIQVAKNVLDVLSEQYEFEPRGQVYVKGKDNMDVFLLIGKKNHIDTTTST